MRKKMFAAFTAAVMTATAAASLQSLSADAENTQDSAVLSYVLSELGITDYDAYAETLRQQITRDSDNPLEDYVFVDLSPGDTGFPITPYDASVVLMFLHGQVDYAYDYNDMDANGDHIVDKADADAYLQCATYALLFDDMEFTIVPHGSARTIDTTFENRTYRKYNCSTGTESTAYTLSLSSLNAAPPIPQQLQTQVEQTRSFTIMDDTRFVRVFSSGGVIGTGFIVSEHIIATAAHVVFSKANNCFIFSSVKGLTFSGSNPNSNEHTLNAVSVHVPSAYYTCASNETFKYDYALIYVSDELDDNFDFGLPLEGMSTGFPTVSKGLVPIKYMINPNETPYTGNWVYPCYAEGTFAAFGAPKVDNSSEYEFADYLLSTSCEHHSGQSGGATSVTTTGSSNTYETIIGIHHGARHSKSIEVRLTRPILQFYLNNPNL